MSETRQTVRRLSRVARRVALLAAVGVVACGSPSDAPPAGGTARMAERLDSLARALNANPTVYENRARLAALRAVRPEPNLQSQLLLRAELARELLRAGQSRDATLEFEAILRRVAESPEAVPPEFVAGINDLLGMAYLRVGQQENCTPDRGSRPCSLSPTPEVTHHNDFGARSAIAVYQRVLREEPDDLVSRWLLNVAYMSIGEYPDRVAPEWVIPPEAFEPEHDIGEFIDVAPDLGLTVVGLAGGGIAEDFDGDGYLDIMVSSMGLRDQMRYFHNMGDGSFEDRTMAAGLGGIVGGLNMIHGDYNNDGFADVFVLRGGWRQEGHPNSLLRNNGDGTFDDVTEEAGLLEAFPTQTGVWGDFDNDGWLDLYIGNESRDGRRNPARLFRNNGDGTFSDVAREAGVAVVGFIKGVTAGDYDNDGRLDLYLSRLVEPNLLFHNAGVGAGGLPTFTEVGAVAGVREPSYSFPTWFFDYDNDGWEDLFVSGFRATSGDAAAEYLGREHNAEFSRLYHNNGDGTFTDATAATRMGDKVLLTMGSNFGDLDNDGFLDLYLGTGDPHFRSYMPNRVFRNAGGKFFQEVTTSGGFGNMQKGHGVSFADFDNDGDQDIHMVMGGAYEGDVYHNALLVNPGHGNHWVTLKLEGVQSNRAAIGARIRVTVTTPNGERDIYTTVTTGGSFGANSLQQEMGLGDATAIRAITITWPTSGRVDVYTDVELDRMWRIREGASAPVPIQLRTFDLANARSR
ncbi:MAG: CRTAC1 family protein [Gemmatimonadetes bacterium]|nr:CRTAC1 family protein [Gemmatimonadota bacterium]